MTQPATTPTDVDVAGCIASHQRLNTFLAAHLTEGTLDPAAPSLLPGWTVGHVLTHLARNADANRGMLEAAELGLERWMYPSPRFRETDIQAGATRPAATLVEDVKTAGCLLEQTWNNMSAVGWAGFGLAGAGRFVMSSGPWRRWREIEVHTVDLGLPGYGVDDWPDVYIQSDLPRRLDAWIAEGNVLPVEISQLTTPRQLAWLFGRDAGPGLPPAPSM